MPRALQGACSCGLGMALGGSGVPNPRGGETSVAVRGTSDCVVGYIGGLGLRWSGVGGGPSSA